MSPSRAFFFALRSRRARMYVAVVLSTQYCTSTGLVAVRTRLVLFIVATSHTFQEAVSTCCTVPYTTATAMYSILVDYESY